jgi:hypothetical protein
MVRKIRNRHSSSSISSSSSDGLNGGGSSSSSPLETAGIAQTVAVETAETAKIQETRETEGANGANVEGTEGTEGTDTDAEKGWLGKELEGYVTPSVLFREYNIQGDGGGLGSQVCVCMYVYVYMYLCVYVFLCIFRQSGTGIGTHLFYAPMLLPPSSALPPRLCAYPLLFLLLYRPCSRP